MVGPHLLQRPSIEAFRRPLRRLGFSIPSLGFRSLHYAYFVVTTLAASAILWGTNTPRGGLAFIDALFLAVSGMTLAGLNTVDLSDLNTVQQFVLFVLLLLGSAIFVSIAIVHVRKLAFKRKFANIAAGRDVRRPRRVSIASSRRVSRLDQHHQMHHKDIISTDTIDEIQQIRDRRAATNVNMLSDQHHHQHQHNDMDTRTLFTEPSLHIRLTTSPGDETTTRGSILPEVFDHHENCPNEDVSAPPPGRTKSHTLTRAQNFQLGGVEYRALHLLSWLVPTYFIMFQLFGCIGLGWWIAVHKAFTTTANGLNPWWTGAFNAVSAFNNSGMSLLDANVVPFQSDFYVLLTMGLLILAGNTGYPIFLRLIIWTGLKILPDIESLKDLKDTLKFLLRHPRRCYTNLFPARHTWWLLATIIVLNSTDWVAFEVLNIGNHNIDTLPTADRIIDGLFQAIAIRSGGFYVVPISSIRVSLQVLYLVMMYISVYPVVFTIQRSNEYVEQSLGIYEEDVILDFEMGTYEPTRKWITKQLKAQLASDIWWLVLGIWLIVIVETSQLDDDPLNFSVFNIMFEAVSGYGCVGVSVGYPDVNYSFSGKWHSVSKLVLCTIMLRGRHRGLPVAIDRALELPGHESEEVEVVQVKDEYQN